jgi:hypothetical protein
MGNLRRPCDETSAVRIGTARRADRGGAVHRFPCDPPLTNPDDDRSVTRFVVSPGVGQVNRPQKELI